MTSLRHKMLIALLTAWLIPGSFLAAQTSIFRPLNQADLDAYIYVLPRLPVAINEADGARLLSEADISRDRMAFVASKVAIAQSLVNGHLSPAQLDEEDVPLALWPSSDELKLINRNLHSLIMAQQAAREARRPGPPRATDEAQP